MMPSSAARCPVSRLYKLFSLCHSPASSGAGSTGILGPVLQPCSSAPLYLGWEAAEKTFILEAWEGCIAPAPRVIPAQAWSPSKGELFLTEVVVRKKTSPQIFSLLPGSRQAIVTGRTVPGVRSTGKVRDLPLHEFPGGLQECQRKITPQYPATRSPWNLRLNWGKPLHRCRLQNKRFLRVSVVPFKSG